MKTTTRKARDGVPLYVQIAADIELGISERKHLLGGLLPNEAALQKKYGVSRFTIRQTLDRLCARELVEKHHGIGTRVIAVPPRKNVAYSIGDLQLLGQLAGQARFEKVDSAHRTLREHEAVGLGLERSKLYLVVRGVRVLPRKPRRLLAYVKVYIPMAYADVEDDIGRTSALVIRLIEQRYNIAVDHIQQEISSPKLSPKLMREMQALGINTVAGRALTTRRVYLDKSGKTLECAESVFIDPDFTFVTILSRTVRIVPGNVRRRTGLGA